MLIYSQPYQRQTGKLNVRLERQLGSYLLTAENLIDAPEILFRLCAVLFVHEWNIVYADICTLDSHTIQDKFIIKPFDERAQADDIKIEAMMSDFETLLFDRSPVPDYLSKHGRRIPREGPGEGRVDIENHDDRPRIILCGKDRGGLLLAQTEALAEHEIDILEARIYTERDGGVRNVFMINPGEDRLRDGSFRQMLAASLRTIL